MAQSGHLKNVHIPLEYINLLSYNYLMIMYFAVLAPDHTLEQSTTFFSFFFTNIYAITTFQHPDTPSYQYIFFHNLIGQN